MRDLLLGRAGHDQSGVLPLWDWVSGVSPQIHGDLY